ncbi:hypothetical protein AGOR_G00148100 [Albula goreensis]|uniref:Uncharacterized protein n=1 Tax=Albula goreensis TaxID=1534307 RepID=A0A8T3D721_9TELE|nr:hypothetical protein AGOR_G00148100 [Albula goreensis]
MASSKSSKTKCNIVIALLAIWSLISLVIIVVWATSPDKKTPSQCKTELQALEDKLKEESDRFTKDKKALEEFVEQGRDNQTRLEREISKLSEMLRETNMNLSRCQKENVHLYENITALEVEIERHEEIQRNLTSKISVQKEKIECLEINVTQISHQHQACQNLQQAAEKQQKAAESLTKVCQIDSQSLQKQLQRCKAASPSAGAQTNNGAPGLYTSTLVLTFFVMMTTHLL